MSNNNTAVTQTSIEAYYQVNLNEQERRIVVVFAKIGESCIADIATRCGWQRSTVSGRMNELKKKGVIVFCGKRRSNTTQVMSEFWKLREKEPTLF